MLAGHAACDPEAEQSTALVTKLCELQAYLPFFSALLSNLPNKRPPCTEASKAWGR